MARFYTDADGDISQLEGRTVAILGYGNQGRSQALNLRDSGVAVVVGNRSDQYGEMVKADGFVALSLQEAAARADVGGSSHAQVCPVTRRRSPERA